MDIPVLLQPICLLLHCAHLSGGRQSDFGMVEETPRFTAQKALEKADECRELARRVSSPEHRTEVLKMAEAWEELARSLADK